MSAQAGQAIALAMLPGRDLTVFVPVGEHVQSVTVGDTASVHIAVPDSQDGLVISALHAFGGTDMKVVTERQTYTFTVSAAFQANAPWLVRVENAPSTTAAPAVWTPPVVREPGSYRLDGDKALRPTSVRDDGQKTYIDWSGTQSIPAVFGVSDVGHEEMVDGYMRGGSFVIDRIYSALVFRIDKAEARAERIVARTKR